MKKNQIVWFPEVRKAEIKEDEIPVPGPGQYLVNATEYAVPDKECVAAEESSPCHLFRHMAFPTAEFNPPAFPVSGGGGCCGNDHPGGGDKRGCGCGS